MPKKASGSIENAHSNWNNYYGRSIQIILRHYDQWLGAYNFYEFKVEDQVLTS